MCGARYVPGLPRLVSPEGSHRVGTYRTERRHAACRDGRHRECKGSEAIGERIERVDAEEHHGQTAADKRAQPESDDDAEQRRTKRLTQKQDDDRTTRSAERDANCDFTPPACDREGHHGVHTRDGQQCGNCRVDAQRLLSSTAHQ